MKKRGFFLIVVVISLITLNVPVALAQGPEPMLEMVFIEAKSAGGVQKLARMGIDMADNRAAVMDRVMSYCGHRQSETRS